MCNATIEVISQDSREFRQEAFKRHGLKAGRNYIGEWCQRCGGTGTFRWGAGYSGTCYGCGGDGLREVSERRVEHALAEHARYLAEEARLAAQRERNGGMTDAEIKRAAAEAELQAQRDRNGGLTDAERDEADRKRQELLDLQRAQDEVEARGRAGVDALAARFTVGERYTFTATLERVIHGEGRLRPWTMSKLRAEDGTLLTYWNSLACGEGETVTFKATVKEFKHYKGYAQVVVQRAKIVQAK